MDVQLQGIVKKIGGLTDKERAYLLSILSGVSAPAPTTNIQQNISDEELHSKVLAVVRSIPRLSQISYNAGDLVAGRFIAPAPTSTVTEPTDPAFTGSFMSGIGETFNSVAYNVGGVSAGALQWGAKQSDGKLYAGGGAVTLDEDGVLINNGGDSIVFRDSPSYGVISNTYPAGWGARAVRTLSATVNPDTNRLTNGDFETGDLSSWTETDPGGTISISALGEGYGGGYAVRFNNSSTNYITQSITLSSYGLLLKFRMRVASGNITASANDINLFSEFTTGGVWRTFYAVIPGSTSSLKLKFPGGDCYVDDIEAIPLHGVGTIPLATYLDVGGNYVNAYTYQFGVQDLNQNMVFLVRTISSNSIVSINSDAQDIDTVIKGDTDANLIYADAGLDAVGMGGAAESGYKLKVTGKFKVTAGITHALYDQTLGASAASINIYPTGNIPSTGKNLHIKIIARTDRVAGADGINLEINDDTTAANYSTYVMWHNFDSLWNDQTPASNITFAYANGANAPTGQFAVYDLTIYDYTSTTKNKEFQSRGGQRIGTGTGDHYIYDAKGSWLSNSAITKVELLPATGPNFVTGTRVTAWLEG